MQDAKFPVPEPEVQKLDFVEDQLAHQPAIQKLDDSIRSQPWLYLTGALVLGVLSGWAIGRR
jgi:hypothetical protein